MVAVGSRAGRALQMAEAMFGGDPRVSGIDYGYAHKEGARTRRLAIRIHVSEKRPPEHCKLHELVPPTIGGIATDVIERRYQRAGGGEGNELAARAVLSPGLSLGNPKARAGTLGLIVFEKETPVVLSCHHV